MVGGVAGDGGEGMGGPGGGAHELCMAGSMQMHTRAKEEQRRHLGEVGGAVNVDAEEGGEEEGDDASSMRSSRSGGSKGKGGRPRKAPKLPAKSGGQPSAAKPLPAKQAAAHVDAWVAAQAGAMPEWQKRGRRGRFSSCEASSRRQSNGRRGRSGGQRWWGWSGIISGRRCMRRPANPSRRRGGKGRGGGGGYEVPYGGEPGLEGPGREGEGGALSSGQHRAPAASPKDGPTFESVVPGYQAALDSHEAVERRYPGDALVEAATNPAFEPPSPPQPMGLGPPQALRPRSVALRTAFLTIVNYNRADHCPDRAAKFARFRANARTTQPTTVLRFMRTSRELRANLYSICV